MSLRRVAGLVVMAGLISSCRPAGTDENAATANEAQTPVLPPIAEPPLDREALLVASLRAASALAAGQDDIEAQMELAGKRFQLRIRFGCPMDPQTDQNLAVRFEEDTRTLHFRAAPDLTTDDPLAARYGGETVEVIEGFWIRRPWLLAVACPAALEVAEDGDTPAADADADADANANAAAEITPPSPNGRIGIAQFFGEGYARTYQRRQRPYEATKTLGENQPPSAHGYDLVLSGRLRRLGNRRVINCSAARPGVQPDCIISVVFERVAIEDPDKEIIAEWNRG